MIFRQYFGLQTLSVPEESGIILIFAGLVKWVVKCVFPLNGAFMFKNLQSGN